MTERLPDLISIALAVPFMRPTDVSPDHTVFPDRVLKRGSKDVPWTKTFSSAEPSGMWMWLPSVAMTCTRQPLILPRLRASPFEHCAAWPMRMPAMQGGARMQEAGLTKTVPLNLTRLPKLTSDRQLPAPLSL